MYTARSEIDLTRIASARERCANRSLSLSLSLSDDSYAFADDNERLLAASSSVNGMMTPRVAVAFAEFIQHPPKSSRLEETRVITSCQRSEGTALSLKSNFLSGRPQTDRWPGDIRTTIARRRDFRFARS